MRPERWFYTAPLRFKSLFRRGRVEQELDEELRYHVERQIQEYIAKGLTPEEARHAALRALGGLEQRKEECRDMRRVGFIEDLVQDLRYGFRQLRRSPGFTAVAVLSLALGIGANTAIFSVIDAFLLRALPVQNPEQLVLFKRTYQGDGLAPYGFDFSWFEAYRGLHDAFSGVAAIYPVERADVTGNLGPGPDRIGDPDPQLQVRVVTGNYFSVMGVGAHAGRTFTEEDDRVPGGHPVAVISYSYWERRFGRSSQRASDIVGRTLSLNGTAYTILGVTPRGFFGDWTGRPADVWVPVAMIAQVLTELPPGLRPRGGGMGYYVLARLKPGVSIRQAQNPGQVLYQQILREKRAGPNPTRQVSQRIERARFELVPASAGFSPQRESYGQPLAILSFVVGLVLLIACANVATLLLARSAARQREMAVRLAIGAARGRILRQLLTESVLLASMGGWLGLLFAQWGTSILARYASSGLAWRTDQRLILDLQPDVRVFAFTAALCLVTGILFGLAPALQGASFSGRAPSLAPVLIPREDSTSGRFRLGKLLVAGQVMLSLLLLIGAGLFVQTLRNLRSQDLGLDREHVLLVWTAIRQSNRQIGAQVAALFETAQQRVSSLPGVVSASVSVRGVLHDSPSFPYPVRVQGEALDAGETAMAQTDVIMPGFFETLGMRLLQGRDFSSRDSETAPRIVIINDALARRFFVDQSPIGKRIGFGYGSKGNELEIVGVVNNAIHITPRDPNRMMFYIPYRQDLQHLSSMCLAVRSIRQPKGPREHGARGASEGCTEPAGAPRQQH